MVSMSSCLGLNGGGSSTIEHTHFLKMCLTHLHSFFDACLTQMHVHTHTHSHTVTCLFDVAAATRTVGASDGLSFTFDTMSLADI